MYILYVERDVYIYIIYIYICPVNNLEYISPEFLQLFLFTSLSWTYLLQIPFLTT